MAFKGGVTNNLQQPGAEASLAAKAPRHAVRDAFVSSVRGLSRYGHPERGSLGLGQPQTLDGYTAS